jgi:hypothetical protein
MTVGGVVCALIFGYILRRGYFFVAGFHGVFFDFIRPLPAPGANTFELFRHIILVWWVKNPSRWALGILTLMKNAKLK